MSHQDLVDYVDSIKLDNNLKIQSNNDTINSLNASILAYDELKLQTQQQISDLQALNVLLSSNNSKCDEIILLL